MNMLQEFTYKKRLMGCDLHVSLISLSEKKANEAFNYIYEVGFSYEKIFSRFLQDSELSKLNREKTITASKIFMNVTQLACKLNKETADLFNPAVQIAKFGYTDTFDSIKNCAEIESNISYDADFSHIEVDALSNTIKIGNEQKLDYGGFLKGYVAELLASIIEKEFTGVIINLGGDIFTTGQDAEGQNFAFSIFNPISNKDEIGFEITNSAIATSGTYQRHWKLGNKVQSHILNQTGTASPDSDLISATIQTSSGARADAFATLAIILGSQKAEEFLQKHNLSYILIDTSGNIIKHLKNNL